MRSRQHICDAVRRPSERVAHPRSNRGEKVRAVSATIVVTGGAGFIGSALVRRFVRDGFSVRVLDDVSRGSENRIADVADSIDFRKGDVRDAQTVADVVRGAEWVCHLAYVNGTARFYREPDLVLDVAVRGMLNVLDACRRHDVG